MRQFFVVLFLLLANAVSAQSIEPREGWVILPSDKPFDVLLDDLKAAVKANGMAVVTQAGPTGAAARRGITIPNNRVVGVFNNLFAVRILNLSTAAMIEAPIRLYVTEDESGAASVSFKTPSFVFAPYFAEGGDELVKAAEELDAVFLAIATAAQ